jgi:hypothetical protein
LGAALTLTTDGQVVVAGYQTTSTGSEALVVSLTKGGKENWRYAGHERGHQTANGIASDALSNLYVAGQSNETWRVFSLDSKGKPGWSYDGGPGTAQSIVLDSKRDLVVAGSSAKGWRVIKLNAGGEVVWEQERRAGGRSIATALAIDSSDNIVVVGQWREQRDLLRVEKLNSEGQSLWAYADQPGGIIARAVTIDPSGTIIVVGETDIDWIMLGLDASANLLWRFTHDGGGGRRNRDQAFSVASHRGDGFVVTGLVHPLPMKFPSLGFVDWRIARYRVETENP